MRSPDFPEILIGLFILAGLAWAMYHFWRRDVEPYDDGTEAPPDDSFSSSRTHP